MEREREKENPQENKKTFMAKYTIHGTPFEIEMPEGSRVEDLIKEIVKRHKDINFSEYRVIHFDGEAISDTNGKLKKNPILSKQSVLTLTKAVAGGC